MPQRSFLCGGLMARFGVQDPCFRVVCSSPASRCSGRGGERTDIACHQRRLHAKGKLFSASCLRLSPRRLSAPRFSGRKDLRKGIKTTSDLIQAQIEGRFFMFF